jgi:hypothetical protein
LAVGGGSFTFVASGDVDVGANGFSIQSLALGQDGSTIYVLLKDVSDYAVDQYTVSGGFHAFLNLNLTSFQGIVSKGSPVITSVPSTAGLLLGETVWSYSLPFLGQIVSIGANTVTLSQNATVSRPMGGINAAFDGLTSLRYSANDNSLYVIGEALNTPNPFQNLVSLFSATFGAAPTVVATSVSYSTPYLLAPNGNLFVLANANGTLTNYNVSTGAAGTVLDSSTADIAVGPNGAFYEKKNNGNLWSWVSAQGAAPVWTLLDQGVAVFAVASNGTLYDMKQNGNFWQLSAGAWTMLASQVEQFDICQDGAVVYEQMGGAIWIAYASLYNPSGPLEVVAINGIFNFNPTTDTLYPTNFNLIV